MELWQVSDNLRNYIKINYGERDKIWSLIIFSLSYHCTSFLSSIIELFLLEILFRNSICFDGSFCHIKKKIFLLQSKPYNLNYVLNKINLLKLSKIEEFNHTLILIKEGFKKV